MVLQVIDKLAASSGESYCYQRWSASKLSATYLLFDLSENIRRETREALAGLLRLAYG